MVLHSDNWCKITENDTVLDWITHGIQIPFIDRANFSFDIPNRKFNVRECAFIDKEIKELLISGAIRKCRTGEIPVCVSPLNCVPKKNSKLRLVVDLRRVNEHIQQLSFVNESIDTVTQYIKPADVLCTIDLKNGYHHIPVHPVYQTYLGIQWKKCYYVWQVLPFGLKCTAISSAKPLEL